ncbi:hypothetical protein FQN52_003723, partial [Onygenales sp. PD_12]
EMEGKRGGTHVPQASASRAGKTPDSNKGSDEDHTGEEGPDGYRYKPDGLMKQSFSITTSTGQHLHLISYYARGHTGASGLNIPSQDPMLRHIRPQKGLYPDSTVNDQQNLPVVTRGPMPGAQYAMHPHLPYVRPGAPQPQPYPYSWHPAPPMSSAPAPIYSAPYLPPLGHPDAGPYPPHAHAPHSHPHLLGPYDRPIHPVDSTLPPVIQGHPGAVSGPPIPYYPPGRSPRLANPVMLGPPRTGSPSHPRGQMDPRLVSSRTDPRQAPMNSGQPNPAPSPPPLRNIGSIAGGESGPSANTVPSINSLMNGPPPPSTLAPATNIPSIVDGPKPSQLDGSGDGSSNAHRGTEDGPKDIPSEKIGFGEDVRALRQLDRVFTA